MRICTACARRTEESGRFCPDCGAALQDVAEPSDSSASRMLGMVLDGQFQIESILGGGAFGTVYRARQLGLDRPVALKIPTNEIAADPIMAKRFVREARSAARVHHPGVVSIYAVGELGDGRSYLAMELIDGQPLDKILASGPIDSIRALEIVRLVASALSDTHAADVVHRDLKPSNIMWRRDRNGDDRITLVDFGIAVCKFGNADATRLTQDGLIGTPNYMSPEQTHGDEVDARADIYALGCILFELVTGTVPFEGSALEVLLAHFSRPAPIPSERNPMVPLVVDALCAAMMSKKPEDRPQSADEVVARVDQALAQLGGGPLTKANTAAARAAQRASARGATLEPLDLPGRRQPARTLATRRDLPDGATRPRNRRARRWLLAASATVMVLAAGGFALYEMRGRSNTADADPLDHPSVGDHDAHTGRHRTLVKDNGEMIAKVQVPDPIVAGKETHADIAIKNKLGQPVLADEIVLTVADSTGAAKGLTARPSASREGMTPNEIEALSGSYYFKYTFAKPGRYLLRVFPPSVDGSFEIPIDVQ